MKRFILDTPTIYVGTVEDPGDIATLEGKELGLSKDGIKLAFESNVREIDFDGKLGRKIKGMERILGWNCSAETKGLELSDKALKLSLIVKDESVFSMAGGYEKFIPSNEIVYSDIVIVGKMHGSKPVVVVMKNCFNPDGLTIETKDSEEGTFDFKAEARYEYDPLKDANGENTVPCMIFLPEATV